MLSIKEFTTHLLHTWYNKFCCTDNIMMLTELSLLGCFLQTWLILRQEKATLNLYSKDSIIHLR